METFQRMSDSYDTFYNRRTQIGTSLGEDINVLSATLTQLAKKLAEQQEKLHQTINVAHQMEDLEVL